MTIQRSGGRAFICQECMLAFRPSEGGLCPECDRVLCSDHFYGPWWRRLLQWSGGRCVRCRGS